MNDAKNENKVSYLEIILFIILGFLLGIPGIILSLIIALIIKYIRKQKDYKIAKGAIGWSLIGGILSSIILYGIRLVETQNISSILAYIIFILIAVFIAFSLIEGSLPFTKNEQKPNNKNN